MTKPSSSKTDTPDSPARPRRRRSASGLPVPTESEARFEALLRSFDEQAKLDVDRPVAPKPPEGSGAFLDELFERSGEFLDRGPYAGIGDAGEFNTKVVGVSFEGRQDLIAGLRAGDTLDLVRMPENEKDANAIAVRFGTFHVGFLRKEIALRLAPNFDAGEFYSAVVTDLTGGGTRHHGLNIRVRRERAGPPRTFASGGRAEVGEGALLQALIGDRPLREAQRKVLARVESGRNTLAVLGTGRGKSLCYQLPAARRAFESEAKTLVLFPLRALANDQFESLSRKLGPLGLRIFRANGAISPEERAALNDALADGSWDVVLSTPEFVQYHGEAFARAHNRPGLLVVDEAHHVSGARHRVAYGAIGALAGSLGAPQVLALTATAADEAFEGIRAELKLDAWVIDPSVRENLRVVDARTTADKNAYLVRELADSGKAIVYCNSRAEAAKVAEFLRGRFGDSVAFYHAGMRAEMRLGVEEYFRSGDVRVVVATSAFGEGIDLPDVRDVVLYHLNFNFTEFNQQAGRAGRDGEPARIHLLFGERDRSLNEYILSRSNPGIETLREVYRGLRGLAVAELVRLGADDIAATLGLDRVSGETIIASVQIFEDAGLAETGRDDEGRYIRLRPAAGKIDLTKTTRYAEGLADREAFEEFCRLALKAEADILERVINRPIYPERVPLER